jgi:pimeloyl-ACP methyl ester carboxylesterase
MAAAPPDVAIDAARQSTSNLGLALAGLRRLQLPVVAINPANSGTDVASMLRAGVRPLFIGRVGHFPMLEAPARFDELLAEVVASFG